jgi:acyl-CoA oxidase
MTEVSGGSDVQSVGTVAVYDHETRSFTLNTPDDGARKAYIGNAALHGQMMVVFAQLKMSPDADSMGVHAFLLPVRGTDGKLLPGVEIEDCGHKIGLNGVDNGYIRFTGIKMPYDALLDRFASIDAEGKYQSPVEKKTARFFKMISTLVTGRIFVAMASLSGAKNALKNALDFAAERQVFGETLLDKQATQSRMLPHLAQAYALHFVTRDLLDAQMAGSPEVETLAAAVKARASDSAIATVDEARKLAGGLGYMSHEKYGTLRNDIDIFRTFEGDNTVLRLLAAKNRLTDMGRAFNKASAMGKIKHVFNRKASPLTAKKSRTSESHLRDTSFHLDIMARREQAMLFDLAQKMKKLHKQHGADGLNLCQDDMTAYAEAYADRVMMESFARHIAAQQDAEVKDTLKKLADLFALDTLRRNGLWHVENGFMTTAKTRAIAGLQHKVQAEIAPLSGALVNAFAIPDKALKLPRLDNGLDKKQNEIKP